MPDIQKEPFDVSSWYSRYKEGCPSCGFNFVRDGHPEMNIFNHYTASCKPSESAALRESASQPQIQPKGLSKYLSRTYEFSTQEDQVKAMEMGAEIYEGVRRESAREAPSVKQACVNAAKALGLEHTIIKPGKSAAEVIEYWVRSASPEAPAAPIEICGEWEYANNDRAQCQLPKRHEGGCHWEFLENRADAMLAPAVTKDK